MCCVGSSVAAAPTAATPGRRLSMESIYSSSIQWTTTTTPPLEVRWSRVPRARVANLSMRGERWFVAQVGASWRAAAAILFPLVLDGYIADFVAAVARAQSELWLPTGVASKASACAELCCVWARDCVCRPHDACESRLRACVRHGRRPR